MRAAVELRLTLPVANEGNFANCVVYVNDEFIETIVGV
jgi:hypothetical protein